MEKKTYEEINNSFKKKLVYHLGSDAGFFSEYNNMILAMLYCLKHKIKFELYSKDANFAILKGWKDYFLPFCEETEITLHSKLNYRHPQNNGLTNKIKRFFFKLFTRTNYLTSELWNNFHNKDFENEYFDIPALNIKGYTQEASNKLINITWRYNIQTENSINKIISQINIPEIYLGFHIRSGDKFIEHEEINVSKYMELAIQHSDIRDVFVLCDDYKVMIELRQRYSDWNFFTLCEENENGYKHSDFIKLNGEVKQRSLHKLFTSMDVLSNSQLFIGTFSSNPGMYLGMRMEKEKVKGVDLEKWTIW